MMIATLSVYNVTLAFNGATNKAVRQAKILALVEKGHKTAEAENSKASLLTTTHPNPIKAM